MATLAGLLLTAIGALMLRRAAPLYSLPRLVAAPRRSLTRLTFVGVAVLLLVQIGTIGWDQSIALDRLVVHAEYHPGRYSPLISAPITCTQVLWLGNDQPASLPATSLHLGSADGTTLLFAPGHGTYRLPSSWVALFPAQTC